MIDAHRVRTLLKDRGWKQADLARLVGVSGSAISQLMQGKTRESRLLPDIAAALRVSVPYLRGETDDPFDPVSGSVKPQDLIKLLDLKSSGQRLLGPENADNANYVALEAYDPAWRFFRISKFNPAILEKNDGEFMPGLGMIFAGTDAMSPTISQGDEIYVSTDTVDVLSPDGIWVFDYGGLRMIRRLMPLPDNAGFRVHADNPASPTFEAPFKDVKIIGRAFWVGKPLA